MSDRKGWIAVDFDGTLCVYDPACAHKFGAPVPLMVNRIKEWLRKGYEVRVFTARVSYANEERNEELRRAIQAWCVTNVGVSLPVTNRKDFNMLELWDDKAITVVKNTGLSLREYLKRARR